MRKKKWFPIVIQKQTELFNHAEEIIKNKGFYDKEMPKIETFSEKQLQELLPQRYEQVDKHLAQIEDILEIKNPPKTREEKYSNLKKYFNKDS